MELISLFAEMKGKTSPSDSPGCVSWLGNLLSRWNWEIYIFSLSLFLNLINHRSWRLLEAPHVVLCPVVMLAATVVIPWWPWLGYFQMSLSPLLSTSGMAHHSVSCVSSDLGWSSFFRRSYVGKSDWCCLLEVRIEAWGVGNPRYLMALF